MITKKLSLQITNKADHYRILRIEPLGCKYGMEASEVFNLSLIGSEDFKLYMGDDISEIVFTLDNYQQMEIILTSNNEEILNGHNIKF